MKFSLAMVAATTALLCLAETGAAADYSKFAVDLEGNGFRGQVLYRKNCRTACHDGSGTTKALSPIDKTQDEWQAKAQDLAKLPCIAKWPANLSESDISDIFSYLYGGASDSPTPTS